MILAPQEINTEITTDEIRALAAEMSATKNVVVIVPSGKRADYWSGVAQQTPHRGGHLRRGRPNASRTRRTKRPRQQV